MRLVGKSIYKTVPKRVTFPSTLSLRLIQERRDRGHVIFQWSRLFFCFSFFFFYSQPLKQHLCLCLIFNDILKPAPRAICHIFCRGRNATTACGTGLFQTRRQETTHINGVRNPLVFFMNLSLYLHTQSNQTSRSRRFAPRILFYFSDFWRLNLTLWYAKLLVESERWWFWNHLPEMRKRRYRGFCQISESELPPRVVGI